MKISLRATSNGFILDLHGQWPRSDDELARVREDVHQALKGRAGPLIYYIHDAKFLKSNHLGLLIGPVMRNKIIHGFAIVMPNKRLRESLRDMLRIAHHGPIWGVYETEEEALRDMERLRKVL
jgi:hypothetical protein